MTADPIQAAKERLTHAMNNEKAHWSLTPQGEECVDVPVSDLHEVMTAFEQSEEHIQQVADEVGEGEDPGAAWEAVHAIVQENDSLKTALAEARRQIAEQREALKGFDDDFMTSETHHPGYVLIPTAVFERVSAAALLAPPPTGGAGDPSTNGGEA